jgi:hypothetical protein
MRLVTLTERSIHRPVKATSRPKEFMTGTMWLPRVIVLSTDGENTSPENRRRGFSGVPLLDSEDISDERDESKCAKWVTDMVPEGDFWGVTL